MKSIHYYFFIPLFLILFILPATSVAKDFEIPVITVEVFVQADGDVRIVEHRTYVFDDSFSWADYRLPLKGFTAIKNIQVSSNGRQLVNRNNEQPGTFMVQRDDDTIQVKWFFNAEDEERTFTISYTLEGAIVTGPEWVEFFWNFISADREKETESFKVEFHLPETVGTDSLYVWKRGPRQNINVQETASGYIATVSNLDDDKFVKIRSVFPRAVFNDGAVSTTDANFSLSTAKADEESYQAVWEEQQKQDAQYARYGQLLIIIISGLSILLFLFFYRKYGKRHKVPGSIKQETTAIPGDLKPAVAGWLLASRNIGSHLLMATLLDLARRKYFIIKEQEPEERWLQEEKKIFIVEKLEEPDADKLTDWEAGLKDFISKQIEEENDRLGKMFTKHASKTAKWFNEWKKQLKNYCKAKGWYDPKSITGMKWSLGSQVPLIVLSILAAVWAGPVGIIAIVISLVFFVASFAIVKRTKEGEIVYAKWEAYKKGLQNTAENTLNIDMLDRHFIYAIALALSKDDIEGVMKQGDGNIALFYWFIFYGNGVPAAADMAVTFSTLAASGTAMTGGVAGGAGASAGAVGGGAGGGAG